jgi:hypothetical protein
MKESLKVLLEGLVDYAGLFPPAALPMHDALRNYARYRREPHAFALGRFVVPAERLHEVPPDFPVTVLWSGGAPPAAEVLETKAASADDVERIAATRGAATVYVEIRELSLIDALARHGLRAKIRTGGVTVEAFPPIEDIAAFLRACSAAGVPFKATAGLHHPLRCVKPLTYDRDAPTGTMHGFLNVFLAAAMLDHADAILNETDSSSFAFDDDGASWRGQRVTTEAIRAMRREFATSFGSCSFEEPIADLQSLGWL